jgi:hypothetical protein
MASLKDESTLVVRCPLDEKELLIAADPKVFYQTDHYVGWPGLLIRLDAADDDVIAARLEIAWRLQSSARDVARFDTAKAATLSKGK